jgi:hypothetical protein
MIHQALLTRIGSTVSPNISTIVFSDSFPSSTAPCAPVTTMDEEPMTSQVTSTRYITTTAVTTATPSHVPAPPSYVSTGSSAYDPAPSPPYPYPSGTDNTTSPYPTGTSYPTAIPSVNGTGTYVPTYAPLPTAAAGAVRVPVAMAGMLGMAAMMV